MESAKAKSGSQRLLRPKTTPLLPGKKVTIGPPSSDDSADDQPASGQPSIRFKRGDQGIDSIEVVCACGEHITIRCEYEQ